MKTIHKFLTLLLIPITLACAGGVVFYLITTKPEPKRSSPPKIIARVEVLHTSPSTHTPWIETYGTVRSYYETEISSLIAGEIIHVSERFQAGESVEKGDVLVELNTADYLANVALQKSAVATAKRAVAEEDARERLTKNDWKSRGQKLEDAAPYTQRLPQKEAAKQALEAAEAALAKAELSLQRTKIIAPYDAIVQERLASPGSIVRIGSAVGRLIAREKVEVRLPLTPDQVVQLKLPLAFQLIDTDQDTPKALEIKLSSPAYPGIDWTAMVTRTEVSVDAKNQVVYVIAEIKNPFDPPGPPLPIGLFVKATMQGKDLNNTLSLPESSIIDDRYVWIVDGKSQLRRQTVQRLYSSKGMVLARLPEDTQTTDLAISKRPLPSFRNGQEVKPFTENETVKATAKANSKTTTKP